MFQKCEIPKPLARFFHLHSQFSIPRSKWIEISLWQFSAHVGKKQAITCLNIEHLSCRHNCDQIFIFVVRRLLYSILAVTIYYKEWTGSLTAWEMFPIYFSPCATTQEFLQLSTLYFSSKSLGDNDDVSTAWWRRVIGDYGKYAHRRDCCDEIRHAIVCNLKWIINSATDNWVRFHMLFDWDFPCFTRFNRLLPLVPPRYCCSLSAYMFCNRF
jgi:hypothetical protein